MIGIVYHSLTGNTLTVVQTLEDALKVLSKSVESHQIKALDPSPKVTDVTLCDLPSLDAYETLIIASPVHAFQMPLVTKTYLNEVGNLAGKTVIIIVTHHFPFAFLGGRGTLKRMARMIEQKEGRVVFKRSIEWSSKKRPSQIAALTEEVLTYCAL